MHAVQNGARQKGQHEVLIQYGRERVRCRGCFCDGWARLDALVRWGDDLPDAIGTVSSKGGSSSGP
eukprot:1705716-Amphidinium_carterae.1